MAFDDDRPPPRLPEMPRVTSTAAPVKANSGKKPVSVQPVRAYSSLQSTGRSGASPEEIYEACSRAGSTMFGDPNQVMTSELTDS